MLVIARMREWTLVLVVLAGGGGPSQARRGGPERRPAADGAGERPAHGPARSLARHRRELPAAQVQRELPRVAGPARGDREPYRRRPAGLQRNGEPLQRLHPALPASADGQSAREGAAPLLRARDAGGGPGAQGGFLEVGPGSETCMRPCHGVIAGLLLAACNSSE